MSFTAFSRAAIAAICLVIAAPAFADGIMVHDAYAIAATPEAASGAAFMAIHNHGGAPDRLIGVRSDAAARVELHTHVMDADGVMRMVRVEDGFDLPTDGVILLERGVNHIMFLGLTTPFEQGTVLSVTLEFETAGDVTIDVPVDLERITGDAMDHGTMEDGTMDHMAGDADAVASE